MSLILEAWRERGYAPPGGEQLLKDYEDKLQLERGKQDLIYALKYLPIPEQALVSASPPLTGPSVGNIIADSGTGTYEDPRTASGDGITVRGSDSNDVPSWQINNAGNGLKLPGGAWYNNFGRSQTEAGNGTGGAAENGTEAAPSEGHANEQYPAAGAVATDDNADVPDYRWASRAPALDAELAKTYQTQPRGIFNDVAIAAGRGYAGLGERTPATYGVRQMPGSAVQANVGNAGAQWKPEPLLVNPATGLRDFTYSSQQALRAQAIEVADMLGRAFDAGPVPEEPSRARQAVQAGFQAAAQAATDVVATPFDLLMAAGGAAYTAVTGRPADLPMFSSLGKAAQEGASAVELLNGLNPVYAGLVAAHDVKAGLAQGDVRPLAAFSGGLIASAALGRAIPHLPGYRPSTTSLIGSAAQHLGAMGVPDWRVGLAPPRPGVLYSNPMPVALERVEAGIAKDKVLLPTEGNVGTYRELVAAGSKGDNTTPHHIPSANKMAKIGIGKDAGIAVNMEQPSPGIGGRHRETFTYGSKADEDMTPRDALAAGVRDVRQIYKKDGLYNSKMKNSLQNLVNRNKATFPDVFKKE